MMTEEKKDFVSDIVTKAMYGAITVLLAFAVNSLQSMSAEMKALSAHVMELSAQSKVLIVNLANLERRLEKLETDTERLKEKASQKEGP